MFQLLKSSKDMSSKKLDALKVQFEERKNSKQSFVEVLLHFKNYY